MKNQFYYLITIFLISGSIRSQEIKMCGYQGYQTVDEVTSACDLQDANRSENNTEDAEEVVDAILDKVGLFRNFLIEECDNINNALAVTMPSDGGSIERYILYDIEFFKRVTTSTGTDWGLTSILAHEVGHHLNGHTLKGGGSTHKVELQADEFSGFVLARMGCSLADAQSAVSKLLPDEASSTHPAKQDRLDAIAKGWNRGSGKKIEVKKIENIEEEITAEMVLANYIDAIGGEDNITKIKTFLTDQNVSGPGYEFDLKQSFLKPMTIILEVEYLGDTKKQLVKNNKKYLIDQNGDWYQSESTTGSDYTANRSGSYIEEFSFLVMNTPVSYAGLVSKNGQNCYKLNFLKEETGRIVEEGKLKIHANQTSKFYNVNTGLLVGEDINTEVKTYKGRRLINTEQSVLKTVFSDYRNVDGVLFPFLRVGTAKRDGKSESITLKTKTVLLNPNSIQPSDYIVN